MLKCLHIVGKTLPVPFRNYLVPYQSGPRPLSTLSAIRHGIRKSSRTRSTPSPRPSWRNRDDQASRNRNETDSAPSLSLLKEGPKGSTRGKLVKEGSTKDLSRDRKEGLTKVKTGNRIASGAATIGTRRDHGARNTRPVGGKDLKIPYTTPASEFLYGRSIVTAALKANRRKFYKLYLAEDPEDAREDSGNSEQNHGHEVVKAKVDGNASDHSNSTIKKFALLRTVQVKVVRSWQVQQLDKATKGRPHNGVVLEASPIARLPIKALLPVEKSRQNFSVELRHQSEEEKDVNGEDSEIEIEPTWDRHPFVIMLDGILDPGNLGALLRSAFFFGADAVVLSTHNSPLSPVALKASAGASESIPLFLVHSTGAFLTSSQANGWKLYAAVPPPGPEQALAWRTKRHLFTTTMDRPLDNAPCVLLIGGEGEGVKPDLLKKADYLISIGGQRSRQGGVDSLNVSVATALLCEAFLRQPPETSFQDIMGTKGGAESQLRRDLF